MTTPATAVATATVAPGSVAAVILAAGKGTRMKSARPKVLHAVLGKPLVSWSVDAVHQAGVVDVICVVGHGKDEVEAVLHARHGDAVRAVVQTEQRGTGHAVQVALPSLSADVAEVLVVCGDTPRLDATRLAALIALRRQRHSLVAMWTTTVSEPRGYGRIVRDDQGAIVAIVEEKDATDAQRRLREVNPGVYCFDAAFLREGLPKLTSNNAAGELYLTDAIALAVERSVGSVVGLDVDEAITLGINDRVQLALAERQARARRVHELRLAGVTILDDAGVVIDSDVSCGEDTTIAASVALHGRTRVGARVSIGQGCVITDCVIDDDVVIHPYSVCDSAHVRSHAVVGPFARLRPAADVGEGAHVGNFVELKKTVLGKGSKANHLAYLGDAVIGAGVNVGAGTITCNYDGHGKYQTTLRDGVFIGSNSTLVAPITIGQHAYIAAGSVVTEDVPADAVAFGRARQENKAGRATVVRERNARKAGKAP